MYDRTPFQITALFLLIELLFLLWYVLKCRNDTRFWFPFSERSFMLIALLLGSFFTYLLGIHRVVYAFDLAIGLLLSLLHPVIAVSFFIGNFFMRPWEQAPAIPLLASTPRLLAAVALLSWLLMAVRQRNFRLVWNHPCTVFVALVLWLLLSAVFSADMAEGLRYHWEHFFPVIVIAFLALNSVSDEIDLQVIKGTLCISIVGVITTALWLTLTDSDFGSTGHRLYGTGLWSNANDLAALVALIMPFTLVPLLTRARTFLNWGLALGSSGVLLVGLWLSQSRGAMLSLLIAGLVYSLFCTRKIRSKILPLILSLLIPIFLFGVMNRETLDLSESSASRWAYVVAGVRMVQDYPVFGVGMGNYPKYYDSYTPVFFEWGERTAHSSWTLVLAEAGIIGLLLFALLYFDIFRKAWRMRKSHPEFVLAMVSYGVAMSFLSHTYLLAPYVLFAFILAATQVYGAPRAQALHIESVREFRPEEVGHDS